MELKNENIPSKIIQHEKLSKIETFVFSDNNYSFPNLKNTHVSEATYYRLFLEKYLDKNIQEFVYLDADTICLNDPIEGLNSEFKKMKMSGYTISARTEIDKSKVDNYETVYKHAKELPFERLEIDELYFNAGVLLVDFQNWQKQDISNKLLLNLEKFENEIVTWDQDVLNSVVNGDYNQLSHFYNFFDKSYKNEFINNIYFIHYLGSHKPWTSSGLYKMPSNFYHLNYYKLYKSFHISHVWKLDSLRVLLKALLSGEFFNLDKKMSFLYQFIRSLK